MQTFLAVAASVAAAALGCFVIDRLARRLLLVRQLSIPLYLAAVAGGFETYTLFEAPQPAWVGQILAWAGLFVPLVLVLRLAALYFFEVHLKTRRAVSLPPLLPAVAIGTAYLIAGFSTLSLVFEDLSLRSVLAASAVTSLVLGLALQPILTNFFAGLVISVERPFRINDWIRVGDWEGRVVAITWRTTHLRTRNNDNVLLPNARIADEQLVNYSLPHKLHLERIVVGVHYRTPPYRVRRALLDCVAGVEGLVDNPTPEVFVLSFDDSAITYELRVWIEDYAGQPRIASEIRGRIWEAFRRAGITIPFPIRTLEIAPRQRRGEPAEGEPAPARLFVAEGQDRGRALELSGRPVVVGRSRSCQLALTDDRASKEHLRIEWSGGAYRLTDLGSSFGTRVNGRPAAEHVLADLDRIAVGDSVIVFEADVH